MGLTLLDRYLNMSLGLARVAALLPSLEVLTVNRMAAGREPFARVMEHLARCPALRKLRLTSEGLRPWAWLAQELLGPRVQCEVAGGATGTAIVGWPSLEGASAQQVLAGVRHMAGCGRPPSMISLDGECTAGNPWT